MVKVIKWTGTILCLIGIALTSRDIFPINVFFSVIGSALWTIAGIMQKDPALFIVEFVAVVIYLSGIVNLYIKR